MDVLRIAAFSDGNTGGNPAGVVIGEVLPDAADMQRVAAEVGFSETAFAAREGDGWRVRYFSPESEVPFCGHATIALGAALVRNFGDGIFKLLLNQAAITVEGFRDGTNFAALFHTRNPSASGGVYEDPATGAATAAFAGYLRDIDWPHGGAIDIVQGEDMGMRSRLHADIPPTLGASIRVSGTARLMDAG
ncbi:PhzF family phenazine biosynthesis protein [Mesorhizobium sp. WSM3860]|uniref:PhzF family phenazine biosynthesis protein n=1 Tax=Mesorhizobium sp. WSM3860 TaxID=2029403 RepID=UPI000BB01320|nr:PhzF family phenazine biosynthesis protein [Mesorhizobium sp. WSM3860]PBC05243.1 hypothetical protein CK220_04535 [Mesorhizobium sp. WSM3860]